MLSPPKQIPIQSLLYKTATCLTRLVTFFCLLNEKNPAWNNYYKTLHSEEMGNKHNATKHENKRLSDFVYSVATL